METSATHHADAWHSGRAELNPCPVRDCCR